MAKIVRFRTPRPAKKPSTRHVMPLLRADAPANPPTLSLKQRWGSLADKLQILALLSPESVQRLERVITRALEELKDRP